ncbi:MAG: hypothetical protein DWQ04_23685 [Chloroflexi bacterium]|nr:MAG: hypothetical protein DWQ04_23685 [Chloroflexota bacterium]
MLDAARGVSLIVRKREQVHNKDKDYLIVSYRYQIGSTSLIWLMVACSVCFTLSVILGDGPFWVRGLLIGAGIWFTYGTLILAIDEIQVWLQKDRLSVKRTPLPWYETNSHIEIGKIQRAMLIVRSNRSSSYPCVDVELKNGKSIVLLTASNVDEGKEIVEEINRALREKRSGMLN